MHTGRSYPLKTLLKWTMKFILLFMVISAIPVLIHHQFGDFIVIPWLPIALIGTAVAFYLGFKNNASYDRMWEARKIWGAIVNESRTWAGLLTTSINNTSPKEKTEIHRRLVHRHIAWLTAMRFQLRGKRTWEHNNLRDSENYVQAAAVEELTGSMENALSPHISAEELDSIRKRPNKATHLLHLQLQDLQELQQKGRLDTLYHVELMDVVRSLYAEQGKAERIKNFPFPRQYASLNFYYVWMFILLLPFAMVGEFSKLGENHIWLTIPFSTIVSWVFYTMEMIGDYSENPFEGSFNDVPITTLCRTIEIDMLNMIDAEQIPSPLEPRNGVLF